MKRKEAVIVVCGMVILSAFNVAVLVSTLQCKNNIEKASEELNKTFEEREKVINDLKQSMCRRIDKEVAKVSTEQQSTCQ